MELTSSSGHCIHLAVKLLTMPVPGAAPSPAAQQDCGCTWGSAKQRALTHGKTPLSETTALEWIWCRPGLRQLWNHPKNPACGIALLWNQLKGDENQQEKGRARYGGRRGFFWVAPGSHDCLCLKAGLKGHFPKHTSPWGRAEGFPCSLFLWF